ncbi:hypothetical protein TspCOW1_10770 [Thiohalobacter sp. COW1]|uniref:Colicin V production protein n=1 Tax=Thiohalobacter thiocyanaticus TaxID=585455 RepID=A0A1Z4VRJ0_9GAMM|nr:colicin V production protein [Thiohalobacter thiocyanaticus]BCO30974.1 hypothetical protein TspCOW1_10770 [Thiohalobacter sp. COW1]
MLTWVDVVMLVVVAVSAGISLWRGFVREAMSLAVWVAAIWIALAFAPEFSGWLTRWVDTPSIRHALAFVALLVIVLLLGALVSYLVSQLVKKTGLSGTDRMLGVVFGVVRGVVIVAVLVLLGGLTMLPQDPWWNDSVLMPHAETLALWLRQFLPPDIADNIQF